MIIFKDKLSGDELFSDAYKMEDKDTFIKFLGKLTTQKTGIDEKCIGANPSAEESQEAAEDGEKCGLDFVMAGRLKEGNLCSKKDFQVYFKDYFKRLQEKVIPCPCEDEDKTEYDCKVKEFKKRAKGFFDFVMENHKDLCCYFGENDWASEFSSCFVKWLDDKNVEVYIFKDGLDEEKC